VASCVTVGDHETPSQMKGVGEQERAQSTRPAEWLDPATQFPLLYEREHTSVYRTVRAIVLDSVEAEDLTQECFARAYRARARYKPTAPPSAWLHRIAVNTAISHLRRKKLARFLPIKIEQGSEDRGLAQAEARSAVEEALGELSPKLRAAVVLQYFHDCSREEIAEILGIPSGTVASRIAKAMAQMRQKVSRDDQLIEPARSKV
jgi:RNA polymerase sigma-70 factor, ECF subfamily